MILEYFKNIISSSNNNNERSIQIHSKNIKDTLYYVNSRCITCFLGKPQFDNRIINKSKGYYISHHLTKTVVLSIIMIVIIQNPHLRLLILRLIVVMSRIIQITVVVELPTY